MNYTLRLSNRKSSLLPIQTETLRSRPSAQKQPEAATAPPYSRNSTTQPAGRAAQSIQAKKNTAPPVADAGSGWRCVPTC